MTKLTELIKEVDSAAVDAEGVLISTLEDSEAIAGYNIVKSNLRFMESYTITIWNKDANEIQTKLQMLRNFDGTNEEWAEINETGYEAVDATTGIITYSGSGSYIALRVLAKKTTTASADIDAQMAIRSAR